MTVDIAQYLLMSCCVDYTPTVGLGCRTGGYMIYLVMALGLLAIEIFVWWLTHETTHTSQDLLVRAGSVLERRLSRTQSSQLEKMNKWQERQQNLVSWVTSTTFRDVMRNAVLRPIEVANTAWLVYIVMAQ